MRMGFAGTVAGMTDRQVEAFLALFRRLRPEEFHHGLSRGAAEQASLAVCDLAEAVAGGVRIVAHPGPFDAATTATGARFDSITLAADDMAGRDRQLVGSADVVVVCPAEADYVMDGLVGDDCECVWRVVALARSAGVAFYVVHPDGQMQHEPFQADPELQCEPGGRSPA